MAWTVLVVSGVLESVWATALGESDNFRRRTATAVFAVALVASMGGLAFAMSEIPVGTAYAVWVGIGAVLTVVISVARGRASLSPVTALLLVGLIGCIVGLKVVG
ncbi:multidrug efflux SMR transporter [Nocardioides zeae]|uniref:Multidrug efflux SMR transporter n=1 Tax=Nocardioides imazamoxiresistens TaxID=3231893 RepID=A0ABU3Q182_9ACTN|nr:multidrug efflux SMR transporter [Nocardioides zeae]MDT9595201.1 multidrug efflux SMR transporter [Nocardioides zeae]